MFNPPMAGGDATPKGFHGFSPEWGELLFETNFLAVCASLGHLPYVVAVALERIWFKKPRQENNIKSDVEMSRVLGFATD